MEREMEPRLLWKYGRVVLATWTALVVVGALSVILIHA